METDTRNIVALLPLAISSRHSYLLIRDHAEVGHTLYSVNRCFRLSVPLLARLGELILRGMTAEC